MPWNPDVTVAAVIEQEGRFLLVEERIDSRLVLNQPAGHLEQNESLVEAVIRETLEESAWQFEPQGLLGMYLWEQPEIRRTFLRFAFCGIVSNHDAARRLDRGIERTLWLPRDQIVARSARLRSPLVLRCIDDYLSGIRYPLEALQHLSLAAAKVVSG